MFDWLYRWLARVMGRDSYNVLKAYQPTHDDDVAYEEYCEAMRQLGEKGYRHQEARK